jgi:DNA-directed RNA polymerase subunit H
MLVSRTRSLGVYGLKFKGDTIEERKAEVLIKLRKYKLIKKEKHEGAFSYIVDIPKDKEKALVWCILNQATVGIAAMNALYKLLKEKKLERAIVITEGRFTHAAKQGAKKRKVELPKHEILSEKEKAQLLAQYKIQPYHMPQIKATDPAVKAIGAIPGDLLRVIRKSATAGEHIAYRYVVE